MKTLFYFLATIALWVVMWLCALRIDQLASGTALCGFFVFILVVSMVVSLVSLVSLINKISYW